MWSGEVTFVKVLLSGCIWPLSPPGRERRALLRQPLP